jgi:hypothetical protein
MASYTTNLNLKKPGTDEDALILDINNNMDAIDSAIGAECIFITISNLSALPHTVTNSKITANHRVVDMVLSNTSAQPSDWSYSTASGTLTISGTISAATNVFIQLAKSY